MASSDECDEPEIISEDSFCGQDSETVCHICYAEFLEPQDLQEHLRQIHQALIYCKFCAASITDNLEYAIHIRNEHLKSLKCCFYCTKIFIDYDLHRKHVRKHYSSKKNRHSCSQCSETFEIATELERHEYEEHNNDNDGYMMLDFFPILSSVLNMKAVSFFQAMHSGQPYECHQCGYKTLDIDSYIQHLRKKKCVSYSCDNCSTTYRNKYDMVRHLLRHKECFNFASKEKTRRCSECLQDIPSPFYYNHTKQCKPIKCNPCNIVFATMDQLSDHQAKQHPLSIEVKFCKFCSRQCVGTAALVRHMVRVHKDDIHLYKYKCVECETPFKHPQKLFAHYYNRHKNLEPYTCRICDKKFRVRRRFTIHIKMDHKSLGFVEFDEKYRVFFNDKKSPEPFIPKCVLPMEELQIFMSADTKKDRREIRKEAELTESHLTETENEKKNESPKKEVKRKRKATKTVKKKQEELDTISLESSDLDDDAPLVLLTKRKPKQDSPIKAIWNRKKRSMKDNKKQLTCNICEKYCYTYQNYQHHMSLHRKNDVKVCIKCSKDFKSKKQLNKHIEKEHSSSKLTETLKSLLEKRKKTLEAENIPLTQTERFQKTIIRSRPDVVTPAATIIQLNNGLSVKKYLETFTPEGDTLKPMANVIIEDSISIKTITDPFYRKPVIKMIKYEPKPIDVNPRLKYPVKFKPVATEDVNIKVKLVQSNCVNESYEDDFTVDRDSIPDVAQEVLLDSAEEIRLVHPQNLGNIEDVSIGQLQSEAPYYKIVKVNEVPAEPEKKEEATNKDLICLPDGTRLITVNPLAHLLGNKKVDEILQPPKNKYYKPKISENVENLLSKALEKAKTPTNVRKRRNALKKRTLEEALALDDE